MLLLFHCFRKTRYIKVIKSYLQIQKVFKNSLFKKVKTIRAFDFGNLGGTEG